MNKPYLTALGLGLLLIGCSKFAAAALINNQDGTITQIRADGFTLS